MKKQLSTEHKLKLSIKASERILEKNSNWKLGITKKQYFCSCGNPICLQTALYGLGKCKICSNREKIKKGKDSNLFIDGRCKDKHFCIDCGIKISYSSWKQGNSRCHSCASKKISSIINCSGVDAHNYIDGRSSEIYYCIDCGKEICYETWRDGGERCKSCGQKKRFEDITKHPSYTDGRSYEPYTQEFSPKLKDQIRQRDTYICQNCGMTEEEHLIVYGQVLHIHHIDYNKENCNSTNLITLCNGCNGRANYNRTYWLEFYTSKILLMELYD